MELQGASIALYGRFAPGVRDQFGAEICRRGGAFRRDLTRRATLLVVGGLAFPLIKSGALLKRIQAARERGLDVVGERAFAARLAQGVSPNSPGLPLETALSRSGLDLSVAEVLAAFDIIEISKGACGFGDLRTMKTAAKLIGAQPLSAVVRILRRTLDTAPEGLHQIVLAPHGDMALAWADGLSTLDGQGYLLLDEANASIEELFEAAEVADASGDVEEALRIYDLCSRADRTDPIAPYNLANLRLAQGAYETAILHYRRALARDKAFVDARYNLSKALEAAGKSTEASGELDRLLADDPQHSDAVFNQAQLKLKVEDLGEALTLYQRYLTFDPPEPWAGTARRAIQYCSQRLTAQSRFQA